MISPHPDPRVAEIQARNARALADATGAPPPDIADDFADYLAWCATAAVERPAAPTIPKGTGGVRPRPELPRTTRTTRQALPDREPPSVGPVCGCGAALDRDGSCFACPSSPRPQ